MLGLPRPDLAVWPVAAGGLGSRRPAGDRDDRERRCLAMIAYAEAASEGAAGMLAVMKVVHNRIAAPALRRRCLRRGARAAASSSRSASGRPCGARWRTPEGRSLAEAVGATLARGAPAAGRGVAAGRGRRDLARPRPDRRRALLRQPAADGPGQMPLVRRSEADRGDRRARVHGQLRSRRAPARAGAGLRHRRPRLCRGNQACRRPGDRAVPPDGPRIATRTATTATVRAWRRTGELARRQAELKRYFKPGWYSQE